MTARRPGAARGDAGVGPGRPSADARRRAPGSHRLRSKSWHVGQAALAAGAAWFIAAELLGHPNPFFAPIAAVVSLGTSYGQRLRRVAEVTLGVAIGVLIADIVVVLDRHRVVAAEHRRGAGDVRGAAARRRRGAS